jgi:hypothetical protein
VLSLWLHRRLRQRLTRRRAPPAALLCEAPARSRASQSPSGATSGAGDAGVHASAGASPARHPGCLRQGPLSLHRHGHDSRHDQPAQRPEPRDTAPDPPRHAPHQRSHQREQVPEPVPGHVVGPVELIEVGDRLRRGRRDDVAAQVVRRGSPSGLLRYRGQSSSSAGTAASAKPRRVLIGHCSSMPWMTTTACRGREVASGRSPDPSAPASAKGLSSVTTSSAAAEDPRPAPRALVHVARRSSLGCGSSQPSAPTPSRRRGQPLPSRMGTTDVRRGRHVRVTSPRGRGRPTVSMSVPLGMPGGAGSSASWARHRTRRGASRGSPLTHGRPPPRCPQPGAPRRPGGAVSERLPPGPAALER